MKLIFLAERVSDSTGSEGLMVIGCPPNPCHTASLDDKGGLPVCCIYIQCRLVYYTWRSSVAYVS